VFRKRGVSRNRARRASSMNGSSVAVPDGASVVTRKSTRLVASSVGIAQRMRRIA